MMPLFHLIERHLLAAGRLHGDDNTIRILAKGKWTTGRIWIYVRNDRPFAGPAPPAAVYYTSSDRRGAASAEASGRHRRHPAGGLLWRLRAVVRAERRATPISPAFCMAHARRGFFELADIAKAARDG
ncbi:hypothetical protein ACVILH_004506 [Bradyrhizobium sp. USDA 4353]